MTLRQKLLLMLSLTVVGVVAAVAGTVSMRVRRVFEDLDREQTAALVGQFQHEFDQRASETAAAVELLAAGEDLHNMAANLASGDDTAHYLTVAAPLAHDYRLNYLEIIGHDGRIISSAQWPARFGYPEPAIGAVGKPPFLHQEELADGLSQLGIFAARAVLGSHPALYVVGGTQLDSGFLRDFPTPPATSVFLYRNLSSDYDVRNFTASGSSVPGAAHYQAIVDRARSSGRNTTGIVDLSSRREDSVNVSAIPLRGADQTVLAVLLVANSRRGMLEVQRHIRDIAYGVAGLGILFAVAASLWIAARISRPIEELARAAGEVAAGRWETRVEIVARDEVGVLARTFNNMTNQLVEQRERLVQTERVAAWRELARRLAHELKNPLFPLQITVENMLRAQKLSRAQFDEVFAESAATLQAEIANLKSIVGRFSDFSHMPQPQMEAMDARDAIRRLVKLYGGALEKKHIELGTSISSEPLPISADPELLHRALSNLILNAMDAMPEGGSLRIAAARRGDTARISIADTGAGIAPEEADRLFTPYYTTKQNGTGLGLAIVQAVVADHHGTIAVENAEGGGARFILGLPIAQNGKEA